MKKAIVTGASRGIGRGIALKLAERGYDIAFNYASQEGDAAKTAEEIEKLGRRACYFQASLEREGAGVELFNRCVGQLGGLSLLVNNAGVTRFQSLLDLTEEQMDFLINLDFKNYLIMGREAARYMIKTGVRGGIINITSSRGERAYPGDGVYGGMKAGLNRAIQSFALDLAPYGIRINNIAPGAIRVRGAEERALPESKADFWDELGRDIPLERSGLPEDIGAAAAFLASDEASYITGVTLRVDGGLILPGMPEIKEEDGRRWGCRPAQWKP
ncbi:MAG: SDR family oxidoreductase [Treponema sp.]|nr:SDR family oxidoreductase [Treponema sp.]